MEIPECPVLRPSFKEFKNFSEFVEKVDRTYKHNYGMVKVTVSPAQLFWLLSFPPSFTILGGSSSGVQVQMRRLPSQARKSDGPWANRAEYLWKRGNLRMYAHSEEVHDPQGISNQDGSV